jgi:hypothetical protein
VVDGESAGSPTARIEIQRGDRRGGRVRVGDVGDVNQLDTDYSHGETAPARYLWLMGLMAFCDDWRCMKTGPSCRCQNST